MTEIELHKDETLVLDSQQTYWNESQLAALRHIGVEKASEGDLQVFHHVCQRTGLDPFARQIYMIGRDSNERDANGNWNKVTKQTIQTGIDGFRLIGRRAADKAGHSVSVSAPEWAHEDGSWRPVWSKAWGNPVAARVTIKRNDEPFSVVALFDEYAQTKRNGDLTQMWAQRPAGQLAKCAEALAWRLAFPQDLSGLYADEEMGQADNRVAEPQQPRGGLAAALQETPDTTTDEPNADPETGEIHDAEVVEDAQSDDALMQRTRGRLFALFTERGITDRDEQIRGISHIIGRQIESRSELTEPEAQQVIASLEARA